MAAFKVVPAWKGEGIDRFGLQVMPDSETTQRQRRNSYAGRDQLR